MEGGSVSGRTGFVNLGVFATVDCVFATVSSVCTLKIELVTKQFQKKNGILSNILTVQLPSEI